jgi:endonuclease-3
MSSKEILNVLDKLIPNPKCSLDYTKDYEILLAVMLSAQCTDKRVNEVTKELFKYDLKALANMDLKKIEKIIKPLGTYHRKAIYIKEISNILLSKSNGVVPHDREFVESLPGVGHKTCNVVFAEIFNEPTMPVDTHILRVSKRLGMTDTSDDVIITEDKIKRMFPENSWNRLHLQLVLFGRHICTAKKPNCSNCPFKNTQCKKPLN